MGCVSLKRTKVNRLWLCTASVFRTERDTLMVVIVICTNVEAYEVS
jgi:hypothetical protein